MARLHPRTCIHNWGLPADDVTLNLGVFVHLASCGRRLDLVRRGCRFTAWSHRRSVRHIARELLGEMRFVVGVQFRVVAAT